jgi:hypothetical protein
MLEQAVTQFWRSDMEIDGCKQFGGSTACWEEAQIPMQPAVMHSSGHCLRQFLWARCSSEPSLRRHQAPERASNNCLDLIERPPEQPFEANLM